MPWHKVKDEKQKIPMIFGDNMGRTALASRLQNAASFTESSERGMTPTECCKGSNIFAKCHPFAVNRA